MRFPPAILLLSSSLLLYFLYESLKTEKKPAKERSTLLELSEERYRLLVESAGECIFMGLEKDILFANHSLLDLLGYSPEEFSRLDIGDFVNLTQNENEAGGSYIRRLLRGESVPQRYETSLKARDGSIHDVTLSLSNVVLQQHHGFIAIASEITPRRATGDRAGEDHDGLAVAGIFPGSAGWRNMLAAITMLRRFDEPVDFDCENNERTAISP